MGYSLIVEITLGESEIQLIKRENLNIPEILITHLEDVLRSKLESERALEIASNRDLIEENRILRESLYLKDAQELTKMIQNARRR